MQTYLLDTNIILRAVDEQSAARKTVDRALATIAGREEDVVITAQNMIGFWAVATRPISSNGFGWRYTDVAEEINILRGRFVYLEETPDIFTHWLRLVNTYSVTGRRVHDARLVAVMLAHGITHVLTFNVDDFVAYQEIMVVHPDEIS